jgi:hypothetical protein
MTARQFSQESVIGFMGRGKSLAIVAGVFSLGGASDSMVVAPGSSELLPIMTQRGEKRLSRQFGMIQGRDTLRVHHRGRWRCS